MSWNTEKIEELTKLWDQGLSASVIGKKLGVSKNAVVGKAHRLKLPARPSPIKRDGSATPRRRVLNIRPQVEPAPEASSYTPPVAQRKEAPRRIRAASGAQSCVWPIGDPGDSNFHFCEAEAVPGKPYCAEHCDKAYITKSRSETKAA